MSRWRGGPGAWRLRQRATRAPHPGPQSKLLRRSCGRGAGRSCYWGFWPCQAPEARLILGPSIHPCCPQTACMQARKLLLAATLLNNIKQNQPLVHHPPGGGGRRGSPPSWPTHLAASLSCSGTKALSERTGGWPSLEWVPKEPVTAPCPFSSSPPAARAALCFRRRQDHQPRSASTAAGAAGRRSQGVGRRLP